MKSKRFNLLWLLLPFLPSIFVACHETDVPNPNDHPYYHQTLAGETFNTHPSLTRKSRIYGTNSSNASRPKRNCFFAASN